MRALVAVDLRDEADALVARAAGWCDRMGATAHLRTVSTLVGDAELVAGSLETAFVAQEWDKLKRWEEQRIAELAERIPKDRRGTVGVVDGTPWQILVEMSGAYDLLVLGTHARDGVARFFLGSVAERVVRSSHAPVLVLPNDAPDADLSGPLQIVCPIDVEEIDTSAASWVRDHVSGELRFELAHTLRYAPWLARDLGGALTVAEHPDARRARALLDDLAAAHELGTSRSHLALGTHDNPGVELVEIADQVGAQLIAIPTHGRRGVSRMLLGSVTERVMRSANCAVLVTR